MEGMRGWQQEERWGGSAPPAGLGDYREVHQIVDARERLRLRPSACEEREGEVGASWCRGG